MDKRYLTADQVAELAELIEDAPRRVGLVDQVLQAAEQGRGLTLILGPPGVPRSEAGLRRPGRARRRARP